MTRFKTQIEDFMCGTIDLNDENVKRLCQNSLERVLNLAISVAEESKHPEAMTAIEDLNELKWLAVRFWSAAQNAVHARNANMK